jgi:hypothetical protein
LFEVLELKIEPAPVLHPCSKRDECVLVALVKEPGSRVPYEERRIILMEGASWQAIDVFKRLIEKREGYSKEKEYFMLVEEARKQVSLPDPFE